MGVEFNGSNGRMPAEVERWGSGDGLTLDDLRRLGRAEAAATVDYSGPPIKGGKQTTVAKASYIADWDGI